MVDRHEIAVTGQTLILQELSKPVSPSVVASSLSVCVALLCQPRLPHPDRFVPSI